MKVDKVTVNHYERSYFDDYDELRSDEMLVPSTENVRKTIDKMVRRFRRNNKSDVLFVKYADGSGYRLMYAYDDEGIRPNMELRLRHYLNMRHDSWDTDEVVSIARAKKLICG